MKKIINLLFAFFTMVTLTAQSSASSANTNSTSNSGYKQGEITERQQQRNKRYEQIKSAKIAFFTSEMDLTPKEASEFWPVYNEYWKERSMAVRQSQHALRRMSHAFEQDEKLSDSRIKDYLQTYINGSREEHKIHEKYFKQLCEILPLEKVARMYKAEEEFRIKMIHQLRSGGREHSSSN